MFSYILKRILVFIPTFFIISLMIFGLSKLAPGDPVELLLKGGASAGNSGQRADLMSSERAYQDKAKSLGLDKPTFYFNITSAAYPKDLYKIKKQNHRETISRLIDKYGNSDAVMAYYDKLRAFELFASDIVLQGSFDTRREMRDAFGDIYFKYDENDIKSILNKMTDAIKIDAAVSSLFPKLKTVIDAHQFLIDNPNNAALYTPSIQWFGLKSQYHTWMFGDYPWFSSEDSSARVAVQKLNAQLDASSKLEDSLQIKGKKQSEELRTIGLQLELLKDEEINKDSLRQAQSKILQDSVALQAQIASIAAQYTKLEIERDTLEKKVIVYASKGFLRFDFGKSYLDGSSVGGKILAALFWTVIMNFISIFLSYIISIPLGVQSAVWKKNTLQFFNVFSYHAIITTVIYALMMVLYAKGLISSHAHILGLTACISGFLIFDFFRQRAFIAEKAKVGIFSLIWSFIYIFSLGMVIFWSYIIALMLIFGAILLFIKSPMMMLYIGLPILAIWGWRKYRNRNQVVDDSKKLWDDGKGTFTFGKTGIQTRGYILDNFSTAVLFVLYSLPSFWIGTILLVFLTVASYGISWFPTGGAYTMELHQNPNTPTLTYFIDVLHHLILPVFCMTYGSFAFLARQTRGSMLGVLRQDYIRTANAKGLPEDKVVWKHAFRNSLFPIITLFSSVFPRALSGSIAIEMIYSIPGMGVLALSSIVARDWPVVFAISMLAAVLTMIGNLVADMLYGVADPRVTFK
jgi:ABC-type dipeptide/oligopeptide/nickel transport system permease component